MSDDERDTDLLKIHCELMDLHYPYSQDINDDMVVLVNKEGKLEIIFK